MEKTAIITDQSVLRQISQKIKKTEQKKVIESLQASLPDNSLGLAAPQIGIFKRAFLAKIDNSFLAFINPVFSYPNNKKSPSVEQCLSLPDITRCVERYARVNVKADVVINLTTHEESLAFEKEFNGREAAILQHENDHLDGQLIIDLPEVKNQDVIARERIEKRQKKIRNRRKAEKLSSQPIRKVNPTKKAKMEKDSRSFLKRQAKADWILKNYQNSLAESSDTST